MTGDARNLRLTASAPGKVILYGEHSVVYGKLAIASSLGLRTTVKLYENEGGMLTIDLKDLNTVKEYNVKDFSDVIVPSLEYSWKTPKSIDHDAFVRLITDTLKFDDCCGKNEASTLTAFFYLYLGILNGTTIPGLTVTVSTDLTIGSGTGSSASLMVSLAGAFVRFLTMKRNDDGKLNPFDRSELNIVSDWAFHAEKIIHGNPSGIDNTVCTFGSMVSFRRGEEPKSLETVREIRCVLIDTAVPKNTGAQVEKVATLKERHPKIVGSILQTMEEIVQEAVECFFCMSLAENVAKPLDQIYNILNDLTDFNQNLLRAINVSHPRLDDVVSVLSRRGLHGKLTGAGGGGYAFAFVPPCFSFDDLDYLCAELTSKGYRPFVTDLGGPGVVVVDDLS